jgi:DNA-binding transcriptional LysR family regulator
VRATNGFDLNLVATFTRVAELGSFTAAGAALGVPKSSVSRAVSRLEEALGVRLLQRTTRKITLTQAGERYLAEVRGPMARVAEASSDVADMGREPRGLVRVSIAPPLGDRTITDVFAAFVRAHRHIRLELVVTSRRVNLVEEGIDLAVRSGRLEDSSLVARKLAVTALGLYAAPSYLERRGRPRSLAALTLHDCVLYKAAAGLMQWRLAGPRGVERVDVTGVVVADDLGTVRLFALAGAGVALMPDVAVRTEVERGALVRVLPAYALRDAPVHLVSPPLRHVPARVTLLRDFLLSEIAKRLAGTPCAVPAGQRATRIAKSSDTKIAPSAPTARA